jgi:probable HAF family extracellular repeat protein
MGAWRRGLAALFLVAGAGRAVLAADFRGLGDLPFGRISSNATGLSADGSVVVGNSYSSDDHRAGYRWSPEKGMEALGVGYAGDVSEDGRTFLISGPDFPGQGNTALLRFGPQGIREFQPIGLLPGGTYAGAVGISADGSVVVGGANSSLGTQAYRWTAETGIVGLGDLEGGEVYANAWGVSGDGRVVVGSGSREFAEEAFRWTEEEGMVGLGTLPGMTWSIAWAANRDGSVIVGDSFNPDIAYEAFRWTAETGLVGLGDLPGGMVLSRAFAVSADGSIIVGGAGTDLGDEAFLWDAAHGMRNLRQVLVDDFGLGDALGGWVLRSAADISADGRVIVGVGTNPDGNREAWRAVLVPEPSGWILAAVGLVWFAGRGRAARNHRPAARRAGPRWADTNDSQSGWLTHSRPIQPSEF